MDTFRATAIALVLVVALAGCSGTDGSAGTSAAPTTGDTPTPTPESTPTATETATPTLTSTPTWSQPETPLQPTENKTEPGRIKQVRFVDTVPAKNGDGYADFDIEVTADTRFPDVDPESDGEPYFIVEINGELVERSAVVPFNESGTFTIPVRQAALDRFESGTLDVRVTLMEQDSHYADKYDTWAGTIEYSAD